MPKLTVMKKIFSSSLPLLLIIILLPSCGGGGSSPNVPLVQNSSPTISGSISNIRVGENLNFTPSSSDPDGDTLSFSIEGKPEWAEFSSTSGSLSGVPGEDDLGSIYPIEVSVSDGDASSSISFDLTVLKPIFFLSVQTNTLDAHRNMDVELSACFLSQDEDNCSESDELLTINENGLFTFQYGIPAGNGFELSIDRDPGRQSCDLALEESVMDYLDITIVATCQADSSAPLFSLDRMHKIRLTMVIDEWHRFVLDTERARYTTGDANGNISEWNSWTHSEIYRQVDFEYLDDEGNTIESLDKVGFKMKGNSSRQWPEYWYDKGNGNWTVKPKRFSFGLKFDEEFDEDEGVYSCIDASGEPAAVEDHPCYSRIGKNLDEVSENDGREFMDVDKLFFRFNRDDPSYQRELLAHDILNSIGVPASRVAHANIVLDIVGEGDFYGKPLPQSFNMGVFQMVEQIDKPFVKRYFGKNGYLFKIGGNADLSGAKEADTSCVKYEDTLIYVDPNFCEIGVEKSDPDSREEWLGTENYLNPEFVNSDINDGGGNSQFRPYKPAYDLKTKKSSIETGREMLQNFMAFVQTYPNSDSLSEQFDVAGFIKAQAAEITLGAVDHYVRVANNYYLFYNPLVEKWVYMVNDFDFVFRDSHTLSGGLPVWFSAFRDIASTYALPSPGKIDWASRELGSVNPILWDIIFSEQDNRDLLYSEIKSIMENNLNWDSIKTKLDTRDALVRDAILSTDAGSPDGCEWIYNPEAIDAPESAALCDAADISIKQFIELRIQTLTSELEENGL